jgi:hypothetical protein
MQNRVFENTEIPIDDLSQWPVIPGYYVAHLNPQLPERGVGYFSLQDGSLRYYSDGRESFYASGRFVFHVNGKAVICAPGVNL